MSVLICDFVSLANHHLYIYSPITPGRTVIISVEVALSVVGFMNDGIGLALALDQKHPLQ